MATFRPYPVLTLATVAGAALLVWLGLWQIDRMGEKADSVARYEARRDAAPVALHQAYCADTPGTARQSVQTPPHIQGDTVRFYGRSAEGEAGWRVFGATPAPLCGCAGEGCHDPAVSLLIETGFETHDGRRLDPSGRIRLDPIPRSSVFAAPNSPETNAFHHFDAEAMARRAGVGALDAEVWLVDDGAPPASLTQSPPERHFGYALTWFGLALALVGVWIAFHITRGRFTLR